MQREENDKKVSELGDDRRANATCSVRGYDGSLGVNAGKSG